MAKKDSDTKLTIAYVSDTGKVSKEEPVDAIIAESNVNSHILHQYEVAYQANQRTGTAKTKDRGEVRGGGKKPWKQKGTGRARVGSNRSPIWRGGGTTFGPIQKDWGYQLPAKLKKSALIAVLKKKAEDKSLLVAEKFAAADGKTKTCASQIESHKFIKPLLITADYDENLNRAAGNIKAINVAVARDVNAHDLMAANECVFTAGAYEKLIQRLKGQVSKSEEVAA